MKKSKLSIQSWKKVFQLKDFIVFKQYKIERKSFFDRKNWIHSKTEGKRSNVANSESHFYRSTVKLRKNLMNKNGSFLFWSKNETENHTNCWEGTFRHWLVAIHFIRMFVCWQPFMFQIGKYLLLNCSDIIILSKDRFLKCFPNIVIDWPKSMKCHRIRNTEHKLFFFWVFRS